MSDRRFDEVGLASTAFGLVVDLEPVSDENKDADLLRNIREFAEDLHEFFGHYQKEVGGDYGTSEKYEEAREEFLEKYPQFAPDS